MATLQTCLFMWHTLHSYAMLSDVTNKGLRLETARKWFDRVMYQVCVILCHIVLNILIRTILVECSERDRVEGALEL